MDNLAFNKEKKRLNKEYSEIFGVVPCMQKFECTREEYIEALKKSIKEQIEIENFLELVGEPIDKDAIT